MKTILTIAALALLSAIVLLACAWQSYRKQANTPKLRRRISFAGWLGKLIARPFVAAMGHTFSAYNGMRYRGQRCLANIGEGEHEHGMMTFLAGPAGATQVASRFQLVIRGADSSHVILSAATTDKPIGVAYDVPDAAEDPINVAVLGGASGTRRVLISATITAGNLLQSDGAGSAKVFTTGGFCIGMALKDGVTGDVIEFAPCVPVTTS